MQKSYWTHPKASRAAVAASLALALLSVGAVEWIRDTPDDSVRQQKASAAKLASKCLQTLKEERAKRGIEIDPVSDPAQSGMIGFASTPITSNSGHLPAKQTSVNPNFAAAIVEMLHEAGVEEGDVVAVGYSGSFPALNVCASAALETLTAKPILIASATGSQFGANHPDYMWLDMEQTLIEKKLIRLKASAATFGGQDDTAKTLSPESHRLLMDGIERNDVPFLEPANYLDSYQKRIALYEDKADGQPIKAYINVGGGSVSVGTHLSKHLFRPGLNRHLPEAELPVDSVMGHFLSQGTPVIHLSQITTLAR
ncbi:MAG: poly-gamma-glutamate system protein, partial [Planctomycetaceae bacterium]|nr:poly-gamma-glutamate system protein [Planctomycetaceae bacterium]